MATSRKKPPSLPSTAALAPARRQAQRLIAARLVRPIWLERVRKLDLTRRLHALQTAANSPYSAVQTQQHRLLRDLCRHAQERTDLYSERLPALPRDDADLLRWLAQVPLLSREDLQERGEALRDRSPGVPTVMSASGGSSGKPVRFVRGADMAASAFALEEHFYTWMGATRGGARARVWGHPRDTHGEQKTWKRRLKEAVFNDAIIDAFHLDEAKVARIVAQLHRLQPELVIGYSGALHTLCRMADEMGLPLPAVGAVCASAEPLLPEWRARISQSFGAPVYDRYGTREVGAVACEPTPGATMVYSPLHHVLETVRPDGTPCAPGEEGDLIVTALHSHAQPFIRYHIGDRAALASAEGSLGWPRILSLGGRSVDLIRTAEGSNVSPLYFVHMIGVELNHGELSAVQIEQAAIDRLILRHVVTEGVADDVVAAALARMETTIRPVIGPSMRVVNERVAEIAPAASGKIRYVISQLKNA